MIDDNPPERRSLLDDPDVRRGIRLGGKFFAVWAIVVSVLALVVIVVVIIVMINILGSSDDPGTPNPGFRGGLSQPFAPEHRAVVATSRDYYPGPTRILSRPTPERAALVCCG